MDYRAAYAQRFNQRGIRRPVPPAPGVGEMTEEQFAAYRAALPSDMAREMALVARTWARAFAVLDR